MPSSYACNLASKMRPHLIFDCYAGVCRHFQARGPTVIDLQGEISPGHGHPNWRWLNKHRDSRGQLIPNLVKWYRAGEPERIAAFGFSAGSNSGLRELLRHPDDREMLSFVAAVDGLHPNLNWNRTNYADWGRQVGPFAEYALRAAHSLPAYAVFTGNNLSAPSPDTATTPTTMRSINSYVSSRTNVTGSPPNVSVMRAFRALGGPTPNGEGGIGNCYFYEYPGTAKEDHIIQARVVIPNLINTFLQNAWA